MDWLAANRDLEGDGLLWIVQPDESGLDASPKFDPVWGWRANARLGFPLLVHRNRRLGFDARRIRERGGPVLCETLVNTLWSLSLQALGRPSATPALVERLWDERRGLFLDEAQPGGARPGVAHLGRAGAAGPARPAGGDRPPPGRGAPARRARVPHPGRAALGRRLGAELRARRQPRPDAPLLARADLGQLRLAGLARPAPARLRGGGARLADGLIGAVEREGLREYYDPRTGAGLGAKDFAWSALIAELADPTRPRRAATLVGENGARCKDRSSASSSPPTTPSASSARRSRACSPRPTHRSRRSSSTTARRDGTAEVAAAYAEVTRDPPGERRPRGGAQPRLRRRPRRVRRLPRQPTTR